MSGARSSLVRTAQDMRVIPWTKGAKTRLRDFDYCVQHAFVRVSPHLVYKKHFEASTHNRYELHDGAYRKQTTHRYEAASAASAFWMQDKHEDMVVTPLQYHWSVIYYIPV